MNSVTRDRLKYLTRHAEAEHNVNATKVAGQAISSPLTELGEAQSQNLGETLKAKKLTMVYHSTAKRCVDTAYIASRSFPSVKLVADERLLEMDQGDLVGTPKFLVVINPITFFKLLFKGLDFAFKNGESFNQVADRMEAAISEYEDNSLIVTHGMAMRCLLARKHGWSVWRVIFTNIKNTQILEFDD